MSARLARAGLALSAAYLAPERFPIVYKATCPECGGRRALRLRALKDGRLRLQTRCGCKCERVFDAIERAAAFNLGDGWSVPRGEFALVTGIPKRQKRFACQRRRRALICPGCSSPRANGRTTIE